MKKLTKILGVLTLLFSLFAGLGSIAIETAFAQEEATVTLHKKKMTELPNLTQNTGEEMTHFDQYDDYEMGAEFDVYDVTNRFYDDRAAGKTVEEAFQAINNTPTDLTAIDSGTTDENGLLDFILPKKSGGRDAVYLFVESEIAGAIIAENFLLSFPVYALDANGEYTDRELNHIHLYPKNVIDADGRLLVTKRGTANNETLNGAKFIIQSAQTDRYLSGAAGGMFTWSDDEADAYEFETGYSYSIGASGIVRTDSAVNHGELGILGFEPGNYHLIETAAPTNASMINAEIVNDFTITAGQTASTPITVMNDTIDVEKEHEGDKTDYDVGDSIPYSVVVNIPDGMGDLLPDGTYRHPTMIITDAPDIGLQYNNDLALHVGTAEITIDNSWMDTAGNGFEITIPASALAAYAGQDLTLTYNMYLDGNAAPDIGYNNLGTVTIDDLTDNDFTPDIYTGGMKFIKIDANFDENNALPNAKFVVRDGNGDDANYLAMDADNAITWVTDLADAKEFISNGDGLFEVAGLEYGTYFLEEIEAPADYVLLDELLPFEIANGSYTTEFRFDVINVRKGRLPSTGGTGILGIVGLGAVLVLTTGGYYVKRQRQE